MRTMPNPGFRNGLLLAAAALLSGSAIACGSSSSADSPPAGGNSSSSGAGGRGGAQSMAGTTSAGTGGAQNMAGATSAGSGGASMSAGAGGSSQAGSGGAAAGSGGAPTAGSGGGGNPFNGYNLISSSLIDGASTHWEQGRDIAFDSAGNIVVVGGTSSTDFPTTTGAYDRTYSGSGANSRGSAGDTDVFVSKFDRTGKMLWSTFLGSFNYDRAYAVEVASNDDVVIAGRAGEGFPTTAGVIQPNFAGDTDASPLYGKQDGFVTRLKADGSGLVWSTYFGSSGQGIIRDMDIDAQGNVYVALTGENAPLGYAPENTSGRNTIKGTGWEGYYGKISSDGKKLMFGTFYGGSNGAQDSVNPSIRVAGGEAFIVASTDATDVDCINNNAYQKSNAGGADLLVMRYAANYSKVFCTYLGGSGDEVLETHVIVPHGQRQRRRRGWHDLQQFSDYRELDSEERRGPRPRARRRHRIQRLDRIGAANHHQRRAEDAHQSRCDVRQLQSRSANRALPELLRRRLERGIPCLGRHAERGHRRRRSNTIE